MLETEHRNLCHIKTSHKPNMTSSNEEQSDEESDEEHARVDISQRDESACSVSEFVDVRPSLALARWSSMAAPLMPSLLLSRETSRLLFETPWRPQDGLVVRLRRTSVHLTRLFEADLTSQIGWMCQIRRLGRVSFHAMSSEELGSDGSLLPSAPVFWLCIYSFMTLGLALIGASTLSSMLNFGMLARKLYLWGATRNFASLLWDLARLALEDGSVSRSILRAQINARVGTLVASLVAVILPSNALASHMTLCLLCGLVERTLLRRHELLSLARTARHALMAQVSSVATLVISGTCQRTIMCRCCEPPGR